LAHSSGPLLARLGTPQRAPSRPIHFGLFLLLLLALLDMQIRPGTHKQTRRQTLWYLYTFIVINLIFCLIMKKHDWILKSITVKTEM
jgi:hypothetical protein